MTTKHRPSSEGNGKQTSAPRLTSKVTLCRRSGTTCVTGCGGSRTVRGSPVSGGPDSCAGDGRHDDDLQRHSQHHHRSVPIHGRPPGRGHPDSRHDFGSARWPWCVSGAGVCRVSGAEPGLRGGHRRHGRGCPAVHRGRDRALRRRSRHGQHIHVSRRSTGARPHIHHCRRRSERTTGVRDGRQDVVEAVQPRSEHPGTDIHPQRRAGHAHRHHAAAVHQAGRGPLATRQA